MKRGVPIEEQYSQGGQMSAFLRKFRKQLAYANGVFQVWVVGPTADDTAGGCTPIRRGSWKIPPRAAAASTATTPAR